MSNVTLEDVAVLGEYCPHGRDSSLNLFVLVFVSGAVSLLLTYIGVSFSMVTFVSDLFIFRP